MLSEAESETVESRARRVLIAASGSGGHLMPARYLADVLARRGYEVHFVGSGRRLEEDIFRASPYATHSISLSGLNNLGLKGWIRFLLKFPGALFNTLRLFSKVRPTVVVGVGGYASVLPILVASLKGVPSWIHEAELSAGNANRFLSRFATKVSVAFAETRDLPEQKIVFTGHPIRHDVLEVAREEKFPKGIKNLLVIGGSQGAKAIDDVFFEIAPQLRERSLELFHQCRPEHLDRLKHRYREVGLEARVESFIHELGEAYRWADVIVCRAGAGTVMEVATVNRPAIFVPFPFAQGQHQHRNAETLSSQGKAYVVEEGDAFQERLLEQITRLLDPEEYQQMVERKGPERPLNAAERIADGIESLVEA